jgi:FkbM family methyltransferase
MPLPFQRWRTLLALVSVIAIGSSTLVIAARSKTVTDYWSDARSALSWDNPLCSSFTALTGLAKARVVKERTNDLLKQIRFVEEDADGLFLYETPHGRIWMPQKDDEWSLAVVLAEQEFAMYGDAGGLGVHRGDVVIDAGAHVGLFTRTALEAGASKVVTFEVTPKANLCLRRNLAKEIADGRVVVMEYGVWHEDAVLPLVVVEGCSVCNSVTHQNPTTVNVPLTTIDNAVRALKLERVDFIKLDIENAEVNALRGAKLTLTRYRPRLAVALENAKARVAYGHEVLGMLQDLVPSYTYRCGACTNPDEYERVLPEVLHLFARPR